jgi:hypothetical protein
MSSEELVNVTLTRGEWYIIEEYLSDILENISTHLNANVDEMSTLDFILYEIKKQVQ